jgi:hypothetical protein
LQVLSHAEASPPAVCLRSFEKPLGLYEIKLDGFRMAARIDNGRVQLLTRTGLDWIDKYRSAIAPAPEHEDRLSGRQLCGVDEQCSERGPLVGTPDSLRR